MTAKNIHNESELLLRLSRGDEQAFNQLYEFYSATVHNTIMRYTGDPEEAKEVLQQVFIKLWEGRAGLAEVASLKDYLFIATRNGVFNYFNQLARQARLKNQFSSLQEVSDDAGIIEAEQKELTQWWLKAIDRLPAQQKQVYQYIERENLTLDQVSEKLQLSKATVKKHLELGRRSVRNYLQVVLPSHWGDAFTITMTLLILSSH